MSSNANGKLIVPFAMWIFLATNLVIGATLCNQASHFNPWMCGFCVLAIVATVIGTCIIFHGGRADRDSLLTFAAESIALEEAGVHLGPNVVRTALLSLVDNTSEAPSFADVLAWPKDRLAMAWNYAKLSNPAVSDMLGRKPDKPEFLRPWPKL